MITETSAALRDVRDLLSDKSRWCQIAFARDERGFALLSATDPGAVQWCVHGAIHHCVPNIKTRVGCVRALKDNSPWRGKFGVIDMWTVNDSLGHGAVMHMLGVAIEALEAEAAGAEILRTMTTPVEEVACAV